MGIITILSVIITSPLYLYLLGLGGALGRSSITELCGSAGKCSAFNRK